MGNSIRHSAAQRRSRTVGRQGSPPSGELARSPKGAALRCRERIQHAEILSRTRARPDRIVELVIPMRTFWNELRFGLRLVRKSPGASLLAMLALGLGIGANTAIFSIANGILLHPIPYANGDRLLALWEVAPHDPPDQGNSVSAPNYEAWKTQNKVFEDLTAYHYRQSNLSGLGTPAVALGAEVSVNFFKVLPAQTILGRGFLAGEDQPGHDREVLLSQGLWKRQYASNPAILGKTIQIDQTGYAVVGVMGADALQPQGADFWLPLALTPQQLNDRTTHFLHPIGLLKPTATLTQAAAELKGIAARIDQQYPGTNRGWGTFVQTLGEQEIGRGTSSYVFLLMGAVGFLLLIACANVANLQFARALGRNHELAIRNALGAGRSRILRQLLTESLVLGVGGAIVGTLFGWISIHLIKVYMPSDIAIFIGGWDRVRLDLPVLAYTLAIGIAAGILAGLAPAWHASRPDLNSTLKEGGRGAIGHSRRRLRSALVILQVALAMVLLVGATLMVRGFNAKLAPAQTYGPDQILTASLNLPQVPRYEQASARQAFFDQALTKLAAIPGIESAAEMSYLPYGNNFNEGAISIAGRPISDASQTRYAAVQSVSAYALGTLHIALLRGRGFTSSAGATAPGVALVSQPFADRYWPHQDALGQHIKLGRDDSPSPWLTIVGVVPDEAWAWGMSEPTPTVYVPLDQNPNRSGFFVLRESGPGDPDAFSAAARQAVATIDPTQPLGNTKSLAEVIHEAAIGIAYVSVMLTVVGVLALALAAIGLYGIMAFLVGERVHEIGIRRALGASQAAVLGLVVTRGAVLVAWGLVLGLPLAYFMARSLQSLIVGISAGDVPTYAGIVLLLGAMTGLACYLPARQATQVDPLVALREP